MQYASTDLDTGLAPIRRQAIFWTIADPIHWHIYAALGGDELILCLQTSWSNSTLAGEISLSYGVVVMSAQCNDNVVLICLNVKQLRWWTWLL